MMNDLISRQAAIDTIMGQPPEPHYPSWYAAMVDEKPDSPKQIRALQRWCNNKIIFKKVKRFEDYRREG